jgi:hypothetical protein
MGGDLSGLPDKFIRWCYHGRKELIERIAAQDDLPKETVFLGFTRHSPTIITTGSAGLNGSVKGVGFVPRREYIEELLSRYTAHIESGWSTDYSARGLKILLDTVYGPRGEEMVDFTRLGTLELAKGHTWQNIRENHDVTLVFFEPPMVSFEVRGTAAIHEEGAYHQFVNAQHDVYHQPDRAGWEERPAYIFTLEEIYDNSATKTGLGKLIYRRGEQLGN